MSAARTRKLTHELVNAATEPKKRNTKRKTPAKAVEQPEESANMVVVSSNDEDEIEELTTVSSSEDRDDASNSFESDEDAPPARRATKDGLLETLQALNLENKYSDSMVANFHDRRIFVGPLKLISKPPFCHLSLGVCIFADGSHSDHLLTIPDDDLPTGFDELVLASNPEVHFAFSKNGRFTREIMDEHVGGTVLDYFLRQRQLTGASKKGLLLTSLAASKWSAELITKLEDNDITVITTHLISATHPVDKAVFEPMRKDIAAKWQLLFDDNLMTDTFTALYHHLEPCNVRAGFADLGFWPVNRNYRAKPVTAFVYTLPKPIIPVDSVFREHGIIITAKDVLESIHQKRRELEAEDEAPAPRKKAKASEGDTPASRKKKK